MMEFLTTKVLKYIRVTEDVDIGLLRTPTINLSILEFIIVVTMLEVYLGLNIISTLSLTITEFIILVLMVEVELGLNIPVTLPLAIAEQDLVLTT